MRKRTASFDNHVTPLVTIVVNHRHGHSELQECLEEIVGQSYPNLEVVLYDFGTTDDSWHAAMSYQRKFPGIISLLRTRLDFVFDTHAPHFPNIRGRYFILIDSTTVLNKGAIDLAVTAIKERNGCAYVLMGNENQQETERFYFCTCEIPGSEHLRSHLLSVPYPGSTVALYDTDIANAHNRFEPYINEANLCFLYSVVSISKPQFRCHVEDDSAALYPHFLSLCQQKLKLIGFVERLDDFSDINRLKELMWERFALELLLQTRAAVRKEDFATALRYFALALAQYPDLITMNWYGEAYESLVQNRFSAFWEERFTALYQLERFSLIPENMVPIDEK